MGHSGVELVEALDSGCWKPGHSRFGAPAGSLPAANMWHKRA